VSSPTAATIKRLFAVSGNRCAFPGCTAALVTDNTVTAEICHIEAQNSKGPRYNPAQTDEERHGFDNLLLLCGDHHKVIDADPATYTVERLREIRAAHEGRQVKGVEPSDDVVQRLLANVRIAGDVSGQLGIGHDVVQIGEISGDGTSVTITHQNPARKPPPSGVGRKRRSFPSDLACTRCPPVV
jgi:hypothetical protein